MLQPLFSLVYGWSKLSLYWNHHLIEHLLITPERSQRFRVPKGRDISISIFSIPVTGREPGRIFLTMSSRSFRPIAVLLSVLLLASTPVKAGPVTVGDVIQIIGSYQNPPAIGLRGYSQGRNTSTNLTSGPREIIETSVVVVSDDSLLSGVIVETETTQGPVNIVVGDVEGTVCDCGEVTIAAGFPKWPLLFLAAVPFFFFEDDDCDDCEKVVPTPSPTPPTTPTPPAPVPEPASLLLFGSGLAAFAANIRRRRTKAKLKIQGEPTEEG